MTQPVQPERQEARLLARLWPTGPVDVAVRVALAVPLGLALVALSGVGHRWFDILAQFTAPAAAAVTIDQVYASPDLAFVSRGLGRPNGSDHRPVVTGITRAAD